MEAIITPEASFALWAEGMHAQAHIAIIAVVNTLGGQLKNTFSLVSSQLGNAGKYK
jgi:hypothetical protein